MIFDKAVSFVLSHEKSYSKDPDDPGGETVWGISRRYHPSWSGWPLVDVFQNSKIFLITAVLSLVRDFYWSMWTKYLCDQLPRPVAFALFDSIVNCGPKAVKWLQKGIKDQENEIKIDGLIGPITISLAKKCQPWRLAMDLLGSRMKFYIGKRNSKYWDGWMIRVCDLIIEVSDTPR